jgi:outer membrane protein
MRFIKFSLIFISLSFFISSHAMAASKIKIGVIDFQKILETSSAGKAAQVDIKKVGKQLEADLKKKETEIEAIKSRLDREALVMSREMREEKEREGRIKLNDYKVLQKKSMAEFKEMEARSIVRIQKEVVDLVAKIGKRDNYTLIVEKREGGVLWAPDSIDITDKVIQEYNADFAKNHKTKK